jgi:hypothetical protein
VVLIVVAVLFWFFTRTISEDGFSAAAKSVAVKQPLAKDLKVLRDLRVWRVGL